MEADGYTATRHQAEVGTGYFDQVSQVITGGAASTLALKGSTEEEQFLADEPSEHRKGIEHSRSAAASMAAMSIGGGEGHARTAAGTQDRRAR